MATRSTGIVGTVGAGDGAGDGATVVDDGATDGSRSAEHAASTQQRADDSAEADSPSSAGPVCIRSADDRGGRAGARRAPGARARRRRRSTRPCTIVSRADAGPQRSHASIGSPIAPAKRGPSSDHTARSPTAPGASTPSSPRPAEARRPAECRHLQRGARGRRAGTVAQLRQQHRLARLEPQRAASADDEPSTPRPTATPAARRSTTGAMPEARIRLLDGQWATPTPAAPSRTHLAGVGHHAVGEPRAVGQPAGAVEVVRRPAPERRQREGVVLGVLGEVGVQPHVEPLGQLRRADHQLLGDAERRARRQRHARHRPVGAVVMAVDGLLAGGEDLVVVGHDVVGRQPAVLLRQRHRAARSGGSARRGRRRRRSRRPSRSPAPRGCTYRWSLDVVHPDSASSASPTHADRYAASVSSAAHNGYSDCNQPNSGLSVIGG